MIIYSIIDVRQTNYSSIPEPLLLNIQITNKLIILFFFFHLSMGEHNILHTNVTKLSQLLFNAEIN